MHRAGMRKLLIHIVIVIVAVPAFGGWRWANLFGADVRALIIDPARPDTLYLGTTGGGGYVSDDGAQSLRNPPGGGPFPRYLLDNPVIEPEGRPSAACSGVWGGGVVAPS